MNVADLRVAAPRIGVPMPGMPQVMARWPSGTPGNAPVMTPNQQAAAQGFACPPGTVGCGPGIAGVQLRDVAPSWWSRIPTWAKVLGGVTIAGGVGFLAWRLLR